MRRCRGGQAVALALWAASVVAQKIGIQPPNPLTLILIPDGQAVALALWAASVVAHGAAGRVLLVARLPGSASALAAGGGLAGAVAAVAFSQVRALACHWLGFT